MKKAAFTLYDASAGSGKTYTLTKEYLKILFLANSDDAYKRILAITFTNKAVEEMKSRIVDSLYEFSKIDTSEKALGILKDISLETGLTIGTLKDKSKAIIKNIIHNYAAFGISTIDKFTHKVIRSFAQDLNLPPNFEVTLDTDSILQEAVDVVISKVGEDEYLTQLLIDFTRDKTDEDKNWDISKELIEISKLLINENDANEINEFQEKSFEDFSNIKKILKNKIAFFNQENNNISLKCEKILHENGVDLNSFSRKTFPNHIEKIGQNTLSIKDNYKYQYFDDIAINKTAKDRDLIESLSGELLVLLKQAYYNISKIAFYEAFLQNINPLSLLNTINLEFKKIQEEQNILSISDFNKIIFNEIQNQPAPFIYERLGEKYRHFFIDEFQDTSIMQWQNLIPLIDNALSSEDNGIRGSLMLVGDPKQSIYRWRGGKAEQFIVLSKPEINPFSNKEKETIRLDTNYRSFEQVIQFNNTFFSFLSSKFENEDYKELYLENSYQKANDKKGGYVNISFIDASEEDSISEIDDKEYSLKVILYLETTLKTIQKVLEDGFSYRDIVLLTRRKLDGVYLANFLTEKNIPILSSETLLIQNATEVKLIIDVLRYLKNNKDQEAKARMLYFIGKYNQNKIEIHDFIIQAKDLSELELEYYLNNVQIQISFKDCRKKSLYEAVEIIVSTFIKEKTNTSYVQYFLDLVLERDNKTQSGIADFLDYWDKTGYKKSIPSPEGNNAVRIMTIHKSKGLEFPIVIYPFAEENFSANNRNKLWIDFDDDEKIDFPKALVNQKKDVTNYGENAKNIYEEKSQEEILDIINVLYVALTRAEEQLYIISNHLITKAGLPNNLSSYFIEFLQINGKYEEGKLEYEFGESNRKSKENYFKENQKSIELVSERLQTKKIKIAQRESLMWNTEQQKAIEFGNLLHEILAFIKTKEDVESAIDVALENGLITISQKDYIKEVIEEIVTRDELVDFFDGEGIVYNEQTIIKKGFGNTKPDKVVIKQQNAFLLDYKTGETIDKYKIQLNDYAHVIEEMGFKIVKKALVYIGEKIEIVFL
ncbi:UvrD-helicase domain-containing protein [Flavobacterium sediminilitoris]|uniref:DNA 3'-5' helicase n=1 Tax=Flavobacterium sediminilitoris TaxID=2024526 RepID=A0ABY4HPX8_9FLAO|nr:MULTISPECIES: UvrD-helicase domain-containing protein [Flavobacterium]UOX34735.1 UvrD-helicase domain-containing protein [Flavobacterium sediminilitoris]